MTLVVNYNLYYESWEDNTFFQISREYNFDRVSDLFYLELDRLTACEKRKIYDFDYFNAIKSLWIESKY